MASQTEPKPKPDALLYRTVLADNLTRLIEERGYSQAFVAQQIGCSSSALSSWCRGFRYPRSDQIVRLAEFLGVDTGYLTEDAKAKDDQLRGLSRDALAIARSFDELDEFGQRQVKLIIENELSRKRMQVTNMTNS